MKIPLVFVKIDGKWYKKKTPELPEPPRAAGP
jgi:(2Fe-2S) ferredoxin